MVLRSALRQGHSFEDSARTPHFRRRHLGATDAVAPRPASPRSVRPDCEDRQTETLFHSTVDWPGNPSKIWSLGPRCGYHPRPPRIATKMKVRSAGIEWGVSIADASGGWTSSDQRGSTTTAGSRNLHTRCVVPRSGGVSLRQGRQGIESCRSEFKAGFSRPPQTITSLSRLRAWQPTPGAMDDRRPFARRPSVV